MQSMMDPRSEVKFAEECQILSIARCMCIEMLLAKGVQRRVWGLFALLMRVSGIVTERGCRQVLGPQAS